MRIQKEQSVGLVIDLQERLLPHIFQNEQLIHNTSILLQGLKILDIPIIVTQQYTKALGQTNNEILKILGAINPIEKISFSCFDEPSFINELKKTNKKNLIIAGIETHVCVLQTAIDLINNGYTPIVVEDCVSSRTENNKRQAIERVRAEGGIITTYESILFEICRYAGTETFKAISKIIK